MENDFTTGQIIALIGAGISFFVIIYLYFVDKNIIKSKKQKLFEKAVENNWVTTGTVVDTEMVSYSRKIGTRDNRQIETENGLNVTYQYVVDGVTYTDKGYFRGTSYPKEPTYYYDKSDPSKVLMNESDQKLRGEKIGKGCVMSVVIPFIVMAILMAIFK